MRLRFVHLVPLALLLTGTARADLQRGADLHQQNCVACHASIIGGDGSALYTRPDRRVKSLSALHRQVLRCTESQRLRWDNAQIGDVVHYLDQRFYKFKP